MSRTSSWHGYLLAILAACGWASGGLVSKWIFTTQVMSPEVYAAARVWSAALLLGIWLIVFNRAKLRVEPSMRGWLFLAVFGGVGVIGMQYTYLKTISLTSVATAILLEYLAPIFTLVAGVVFLKHELRWQKIVAVIGSVAGCAIAVGVFQPGGLTASPKGIAWGLSAALFFALYTIMGSVGNDTFDPITLLFYGFFFASIVWLFTLGPTTILSAFSRPSLAIVIITSSLISTVLSFGAYLVALKTISATSATIAAMLEPIVASLGAAVLFSERLTPSLVIGGVLILGSIAYLQSTGVEKPA